MPYNEIAAIFTSIGIALWITAIFIGPVWGPPMLIAGAILLTNTAIMMTIKSEGL